MRPISSGIAGGSSLALAWKALSVLDRPNPAIDPALLCEAFCTKLPFLDWFSFSAGRVVGILLFAFVEAVVTLRWVILAFFQANPHSREEVPAKPGRPLYKIL